MLKDWGVYGGTRYFVQYLITLPNPSVSMEANGYCMSRILLVWSSNLAIELGLRRATS
jgi:hypothetical protein